MKKHTEEAYQKNIGLAAANDDLLKLMRDDPCMPRATRRNMEIADETRAEQLKEERMTAADRDARDAARAAHAAKEAAVQKAFKEREAKEREGRKKMAKKLAATQPLTMGTGPVPVDVGDVEEAFLYEKLYDSFDVLVTPPAGTRARDLAVDVTPKTISIGLKGRPPYLKAGLNGAVHPDETIWTLTDGVLRVELQKADRHSDWYSGLTLDDDWRCAW